VLLLPYLGEEDLYKQFKLDEPWNGPNNSKLLERMPKVFVSSHSPLDRQPGAVPRPWTRFQVFVGKGAAFDGKEGLRLADFKDGPGNTILIAEANAMVLWTKPEDLPFRADGPLPRLGWMQDMNAAFGDGKVRVVQGAADPKEVGGVNPAARFDESVLRALITHSGGEATPATTASQGQLRRIAAPPPLLPGSQPAGTAPR
jgi:hypothetical protein